MINSDSFSIAIPSAVENNLSVKPIGYLEGRLYRVFDVEKAKRTRLAWINQEATASNQQSTWSAYGWSLLKKAKDLTGITKLGEGIDHLRSGEWSKAASSLANGALRVGVTALATLALIKGFYSPSESEVPPWYDPHLSHGNNFSVTPLPIPGVDPSLVTTAALGVCLDKGPQLTLITAYDNNVKDYADYVIPNQVEYAKKHSLEHISYHGNLAHDDGVYRAPYWSKVVALNDQLQKAQDGEWLVWLDASAIFTNSEKTFTDIIHRYGSDWKGSQKDIIVTTDPHVPINNAVFLVRNTPWTREWIKEVWQRIDLARGGEANCWSWGQPICHYEQQAMTELFERDPDVKSHVVVIPNKEMNSFYRYSHEDKYRNMKLNYDSDPESSKWSPGDFICKVTGMDRDRRLAIVKHVVENCIQKECERKFF